MLWPVCCLACGLHIPSTRVTSEPTTGSSWVTLDEGVSVLRQLLLQRECVKRGRLPCGYSCALFTCPESVIDSNSSRQGEQGPESSAWFYLLLRSPGQLPHTHTF